MTGQRVAEPGQHDDRHQDRQRDRDDDDDRAPEAAEEEHQHQGRQPGGDDGFLHDAVDRRSYEERLVEQQRRFQLLRQSGERFRQ